jgi:DNA-binding Lrp family transcriptional regulator
LARFLAFVDIFVESSLMDDVVQELIKLDNLEELYEVTGEFDIVTLLSAADIEEFRDVLKNRIMKIKGVKSTVSSVVLEAYKGPRCVEPQQRVAEPQQRVIEPQKAKPSRQ